jgi:hypothetical protein
MTEVRFPGAKLNINVTDVGGVSITNNGEFDIPTGSTYKFKINSTDKATIDSTTLKTDKISELTSSADITLDNDIKVDKIKEKTGSAGVTIDDDLKVDKIVEKTASNGIELANYTKLSANPRFLAGISGDKSLSTASSFLKVAFDTEYFDIGNGFNTTTNTYTFPIGGTYLIYYNIFFQGINADQNIFALALDYNGSAQIILSYLDLGTIKTSSGYYILSGTYVLVASSSETLSLIVQSSGTLTTWSCTTGSPNYETRFGATLISI